MPSTPGPAPVSRCSEAVFVRKGHEEVLSCRDAPTPGRSCPVRFPPMDTIPSHWMPPLLERLQSSPVISSAPALGKLKTKSTCRTQASPAAYPRTTHARKKPLRPNRRLRRFIGLRGVEETRRLASQPGRPVASQFLDHGAVRLQQPQCRVGRLRRRQLVVAVEDILPGTPGNGA